MNILIEDITKMYNLSFTKEELHAYENEIINIFNGYISKYYTQVSDLCYYIANYYRYIKNDYSKAEEYYLMSINNGNINNYSPTYKAINIPKSCYEIAIYYKDNKQYDLMTKYFMMGIKLNDPKSMNGYGYYLHHVKKDYENAVKYYLMAIEHKYYGSAHNLASYYDTIEENKELMEQYYRMSADNGNYVSIIPLLYYYKSINNYELLNKYAFIIFKKNFDDYCIEGEEDEFDIYKHYDNEVMHILKSVYANGFEINYLIYKHCGMKYIDKYYKKSHQFTQFIHKVEREHTIETCIICYNDDVKCIKLDRCNHRLCSDCYIILLNKKCPYCRK